MGQGLARGAGDATRRADRKQDGHAPDRKLTEEGRGKTLRAAQKSARIRRGDGRTAQAGLQVVEFIEVISGTGFATREAANKFNGDMMEAGGIGTQPNNIF